MSKEIHRLAQGKECITKGTNTIFLLSHKEICLIPDGRTITYAHIVIDHRPPKDDPNRVRITVGGNLINYPFELATRTTDMVSSEILWNSTISTKGARFAGADIKNMYLEMPLDRYEYMEMPISLSPQDIIEHYDLRNKALNGYVYMEICKGMYGLPQPGILANKLLKKRLARHGYFELPAYGNMTHAQFGSISQWMILGSSTIYSTCMMHSGKKHRRLLKTALVIYTAASTSNEIITNTTSA